MTNEFDEEKEPPSGRRNSAIHQEESLRRARQHESRARQKRQPKQESESRPEQESQAEQGGKAKHGSRAKRGTKKASSTKRRRIITMAIAECFALLFIFGYGFIARRWTMIQRIDDWEPEAVQNENFSVDLAQYEKQKGHWGIYIFGVDSRGSNVSKGTNADVNMICDINQDTGEVRLVSVFRDTYLNINDDNQYNKINRAYFTGGPTEAAKALNKNLDLNITDFVTFNWKAVADGINILGGVDMEISKAEFYYINSFITETVEATGVYSTHLTQAGLNHLDGVQAVAYGRLRLMDTDYARTERQRKVIQAAFEKAKEADWATLNQLAVTVFPQVATSVELTDILNLLMDVGKCYIGETGGFPFARGEANMGSKGACVIPQTLYTNVIELHEFLYGEENYTPSSTVETISAKIASDTGMYTQGVSVDHVSTTGGAVPTQASTTAAAETEETKKTSSKADSDEETEESDEKSSTDEDDSADESSSASSSGGPGKGSMAGQNPTAEAKPSDEDSTTSAGEETTETDESATEASTAERKPGASRTTGAAEETTAASTEVITVPEAPVVSYDGPSGTAG